MTTTKMTIAHCDLDAAVAVKWDTTTCLIAQSVARTFKRAVIACGITVACLIDGRQVDIPTLTRALAAKFDRAQNSQLESAKQLIAEIRRALPMEVEVTVREAGE